MTSPTPADPPDVPAALRRWAKGIYPSEAAVELLLRFQGGRFADPDLPWIRHDAQDSWIDPDDFDHIGPYSGGEQRVLRIVGSLLSSGVEDRINLGDELTGLDRATLALVLAAVAHAGGSHEHSRLELGDPLPNGTQVARTVRLPSLYPWPAP